MQEGLNAGMLLYGAPPSRSIEDFGRGRRVQVCFTEHHRMAVNSQSTNPAPATT